MVSPGWSLAATDPVRWRRRGCLCKPCRGRRANGSSHCSVTARQARHDIRCPARATTSAHIDGKKARRQDRASFARSSQCRSGTCTRLQPSDRRAPSAVWLRCAGSCASYCSGRTLHRDSARRSVVCGWLRVCARLAQAWSNANRHVVQVGRELSPNDMSGATVHVYPNKFGWAIKNAPPFPSDPHYDAKAWELCLAHKGSGRVMFWNVTGPAQP